MFRLDPVFDPREAERMLELRDGFGPYGMYSNEGYDTSYAAEVPQRIDAICTHLRPAAADFASMIIDAYTRFPVA